MDQVALIAELMRLHPPRYLFGGWAEDALLNGKATRSHDDIDLMVPLDDIDLVLDQVEALGFTDVHTKFMIERGKPIVVAVYRDGFELELIVYQVDKAGRAFFDLPFEGHGIRRVWMPDGTFSAPPAKLGDVTVRTISPLALYQVREASREVFGGFRDKDNLAQAALRAKFFAKTPERELHPRIEAPA